jgi:hypothetical protein
MKCDGDEQWRNSILPAPYSSEHSEGVKALWQQAFPDDPPWNAADVSIPAKLAMQPELFLVALDGDLVVGSTIAGYDGHRGWLYAAAVLNSHCRQVSGPHWRAQRRRGFAQWAAARSTCRSGAQTPPPSSFTGGLGI